MLQITGDLKKERILLIPRRVSTHFIALCLVETSQIDTSL